MYDAVRAIGGKRPAYTPDLKASSGASVDAAVRAPGKQALGKLTPSQRGAVDAALNATLLRISDARAKADGVEIGTQVADALIALRNGDQSNAVVAFNPKPGAGRYRPTYPHNLPAILPQWGGVTPFVLKGLAVLETPAPPPPGRAQYLPTSHQIKS